MTACNFRSLLLAAIVLSNCITWTASRHHYKHNIHQHRTRHRRQGAGLFLSASYVIPGGEGSGAWGEWGEVSPCSRTCGGGVASQKRICLQLGSDDQPQCMGGDTKYFSCQTQDCPTDSSFRAEQCADFDDIDFRGFKYNWVPYTKAPKPCELNCMPHGERFYFRHKAKVIDGTRCNDESFDVCVNGDCQPVGCDMMLGSNAREDKCRECRGNGANCHTTSDIFNSQDLMMGYNDILLIPQGSTTIIIEELEPSNNYLALRAKNGTYYLNGHYHIDFPRSIEIAGALWYYERSQQGFAAPDKLRCLGPTNEPLYLSILLQDANVGIRYEYSVPNSSAPPTDRRYNWVHEDFTPCSASCGGGFQTRNVTCRSREELELVDDSLCDEGLKPATNQTCNPDPCPAQWVEGPWGECSKRCGSGGIKSREVTCQKIIANGYSSIVADKECFDLLGPKPELFQECNRDAPCPTWFVGHWKPCDTLCDEGKQTRQVVCYQKKNGRKEVLDDENCIDKKPEVEQPCMLRPCDGVDWITSDWSGCDTCLSEFRTRRVVCATSDRQLVNDSFCESHQRPDHTEKCSDLPPCEVQWYATQWTKCSVECGEGVQTRKIFCGVYDGHNVAVVEDERCAALPKYKSTRACAVPPDACPSQWFAGPWEECSKKCGGGTKDRKVMCFRGDSDVSDCDINTIPSSTQTCNSGPCDPDETLPVDSKSTTIMDYDECADDDYPEVGLDEDFSSFTRGDIPLSDSPESVYEVETPMFTKTGSGSGFGPISTTDDLSTYEGSGSTWISEETGATLGITNTKFYSDTTEETSTPLPPDDKTTKTTRALPSGDKTEKTTRALPSSDSGVTEAISSITADVTESTISDFTASAEETDSTTVTANTEFSKTESSATEETVSTVSSILDDTSPSDIDSVETSKTDTDSSVPTAAYDTETTDLTALGETLSTSVTMSTETDETYSTELDIKETATAVSGETTATNTETNNSTDGTATIGESDSTFSKPTERSTYTEDTSSTIETSDTSSTNTEETITTRSTETVDNSSMDTEETVGTETTDTTDTDTEETIGTESTATTDTTDTDTEETIGTESTATTDTTDTDTEETIGTESTASTDTTDTDTEETIGTESTATTDTTDTDTEETIGTESTATTDTTDTDTEETIGTESTATTDTTDTDTEETIGTESTATTDTTDTDTEETIGTESTAMTDTQTTDSEETFGTGSTTITDLDTTGTEETVGTGFTATTDTDITYTKETSSTESTEETASTISDQTTGSEGFTESTITTPDDDKTTRTTRAWPKKRISTKKEESTVSTESSASTNEASTDSSESTVEEISSTVFDSTTESGSTVSSSESSESSTINLSTSRLDSTSESSTEIEPSTIISSTSLGETETEQSSTASSESTIHVTGISTSDFESTTTAELSTTISSESTTIETRSTTEESSTTFKETELTSTGATGSTEEETSTTGSGSTQESTITEESTTSAFSITEGSQVTESSEGSESTTEGLSNTESSTTEGLTQSTEKSSESTTEGLSTTESSTTEGLTLSTEKTPWDVFTTVKKRTCRRRKLKCEKSKFGCCPDKKTAASGPFEQDCPRPRTCKESTFGCCPDGLSAPQGDNNEGCPTEPCADTLFGCCASDNLTAAQGNDQEGCPPPPPACRASKYGCCDDESEATGPQKAGCPESETTTTSVDTETTSWTTETTLQITDTTSQTTESSISSESSEANAFSTTSATTIDITSSTTLKPCAGFRFGCCPDNKTEASGPDGQGCPCNASEFGCCPDGVSPALGVQQEGCPGPCATSQYGCCEDGKTPAHGPDFEGCCLLQAFGCCPDNRKPAEGPHLEGCGCQYARHGCCPDNVTIAQGPDNQGCSCRYSEHGCCPDWRTPALGPNKEGCGCNTYQFGCCADGVTVANGPDQQGCHCRDSEYGCCGDEETPATGPNGAGCDCSSSQHGCCPDGHTEATGPKFLGCTDVPENKQAVCSLSADPGPCHNFTAMWYYDLAYGGCSRFWYGGCDGNGNRFATKEGCEDVCVQPPPKEACALPAVAGPCDAAYVRWSYNGSREQCVPFRYGGCLGNSNNFESHELCTAQCEPQRAAGQCNLPIEQGPCAGNFSRWGFNSESHRCEQFIWGGCEGNSNRFSTEAACQMQCDPPGTPKPQCTEPQEAGDCTEKEALWAFSQSENRCVPFYYSGCGGNDNKFNSREECEQICPSAYVPDKCTLPAETGECSIYREKWFFDTRFERCRQFYYGGCGGNENNFDTEVECANACSELRVTTTTTTTTTVRPVEPPQPEPQPQTEAQPQLPEPVPEIPDFCFGAIDAGPCQNKEVRYAYDSHLGRCKTFEYGGCGGNQNNFPDEEICNAYCHPAQDICQLPMLSGPCDESLMRWFYDSSSDSCNQFTYGGCEGNDNRFESREDCESRCRGEPMQTRTTVTTQAPTTTVKFLEVPPACRVPESLEECQHGGEAWYFEPQRRECVAHANRGPGAACRHSGTFASQEACERSCGAFRDIDVCQHRVDPGPCQSYVTKVYFEASTGRCREFAYGGCLGGANRFSSVEECLEVCKPEIDPCTLTPEQGNCFAYVQLWYYDTSRDQCLQFLYTGCAGNENRFETREDCEGRCKRPAAVTTTVAPVAPPQEPEELECVTPSSLAPCGGNITVFYYDSNRQQCLAGGIGGCGLANSYNTEEECERRCGAFRGQDVCGARLDPGPCRASIPKFFWDATLGSCQPYAYSGCAGGPNRFSTSSECENVCGGTGPARECLQEVDTGEGCGAAPGPRWHYSVAHVDCVVFAYQGCGGNDNNFYSYEECADVCKLSSLKHPKWTGGDVPPPDCDILRKECDALVCQYGIDRVVEDGCERCLCKDPCLKANCTASEQCVPYKTADIWETQYSARCVPKHETNEVEDCSQYAQECAALRCPYGVQRTLAPAPGGCQRCACVPLDTDCAPLREECRRLRCAYGTARAAGADGCERCRCNEQPCASVSCQAGERCIVLPYRDAVDNERKYSAECRSVVKAGACPMDETTSNEVTCRRECQDDADCRGVGKCCRRGCSALCLVPVEPTSPHPLLTTTYSPDVVGPPRAVQQEEAPVEAAEGGTATLRCLFHGNPPPKITWRRRELTIDGTEGRYRLTSEGALQIVSLYRNDSGVYICIADNGLGLARQEVHLVVNDPVQTSVGIAGEENAVMTGELGKPLVLRCLAYGYPLPQVYWYHSPNTSMVPYNNADYEARGNILLIRSLTIETLGEYTCQAYNGEGKAATWIVTVRAYRPEGIYIDEEFVVPRHSGILVASVPPPTARETTTTTTSTTEPPIAFTVPVNTRVSAPQSVLNSGAELRLTCDVDGFPEPEVHWSKDGVRIQPDGRVSISGGTIVSRLTVSSVSVSDSGSYTCHAANAHESHSDSAQVTVQQLVVPARCKDNKLFANCDLIVRSKFCNHEYYSKFCCKSCVEAGQLDPHKAELQGDQPYRRK